MGAQQVGDDHTEEVQGSWPGFVLFQKSPDCSGSGKEEILGNKVIYEA